MPRLGAASCSLSGGRSKLPLGVANLRSSYSSSDWSLVMFVIRKHVAPSLYVVGIFSFCIVIVNVAEPATRVVTVSVPGGGDRQLGT